MTDAPGLGWAFYDSPIGRGVLVWDAQGRLAGAQLAAADEAATQALVQRRWPGLPEQPPPAAVQDWLTRLAGLFRGVADDFTDLPLAMDALGAFDRRVLTLARAIPPGQTRRYGELAQALGEPGAARAVGAALGRNPFAPIVPCHRVLAAGGRTGGFSAPGGAADKQRLLALEAGWFGPQRSLF